MRELSGRPVITIHANLTSAIDLTQAPKLPENTSICFQGPVKVGQFDIPDEMTQQMLANPNPHGISNAEVLKFRYS